MDDLKNEIWKNIPGYEGFYQASNKGRIRSLPRVIVRSNGIKQSFVSRILKTSTKATGYIGVVLWKVSNNKNHLVHRLVLQSFNPTSNEKLQVNHINHIKNCNLVENLEWVTSKRNTELAIVFGKHATGEKSTSSKLSSAQVVEIREKLKNSTCTQASIAREYNVTPMCIYNIKINKSWKHLK